jgi:Flp pilus assembly protein TadG
MRLLSGIQSRLIGNRGRLSSLTLLKGTRAEQLLEVALSLPVLLALVVGATDFGGAYKLQHDLNNACREGSRFASGENTADLNCGTCSATPPSVTAVRDVVANYMTQDGLTSCTVGTSPSFTANTLTWTYTSSTSGCTNFSLVIERGYSYSDTTGTSVIATQVTVNYPYTWMFSKVAGSLGGKKGGGGTSLPSAITANAIMENLP